MHLPEFLRSELQILWKAERLLLEDKLVDENDMDSTVLAINEIGIKTN